MFWPRFLSLSVRCPVCLSPQSLCLSLLCPVVPSVALALSPQSLSLVVPSLVPSPVSPAAVCELVSSE